MFMQTIYFPKYFKELIEYENLLMNKPVEAMEKLRTGKYPSGKIFNTYNTGGYVIYSMPDGMMSIIDGRTNLLYTPSDMDNVISASIIPKYFIDLDQEVNFNYAVTLYDYLLDGFFDMFLRSGLLHLEYAGQYSALFLKGKNKFPKARLSMSSPGCLTPYNNQEIKTELDLAMETHNENDLLPVMLSLFHNYFSVTNKIDFLNNYKLHNSKYIYEHRALAALYSKNNDYHSALNVYLKCPDKLLLSRDRIYILLLNKKLNNIIDAQLYFKILEELARQFDILSLREKKFLVESLESETESKLLLNFLSHKSLSVII